MNISEITGSARKTIRQMSNLYLNYVLDSSKYNDLLDLTLKCKMSDDPDIAREAGIMIERLDRDIVKIFQSGINI
jgi:hypothetical protein